MCRRGGEQIEGRTSLKGDDMSGTLGEYIVGKLHALLRYPFQFADLALSPQLEGLIVEGVGVVCARRQISQLQGADALERTLGSRDEREGFFAAFISADAQGNLSIGASDRHGGIRSVGIGA